MDDYRDIINHEHHVSKTHPHMSMEKRAAQFAPFAAVAGHKESVDEAARFTDSAVELDEEKIRDLNDKLALLKGMKNADYEITLTYFEDDRYKDGGKYIDLKGRISKIDEINQQIITENGTVINMDHIADIKGKIFDW